MKSSDGWPMILLSEPFHIGDDVMEHYLHPKLMEIHRIELSLTRLGFSRQ